MRRNRSYIESEIRAFVSGELKRNPDINFSELVDLYEQTNEMSSWRKQILHKDFEKKSRYSKK